MNLFAITMESKAIHKGHKKGFLSSNYKPHWKKEEMLQERNLKQVISLEYEQLLPPNLETLWFNFLGS